MSAGAFADSAPPARPERLAPPVGVDAEAAAEVWRAILRLVFDNERRREVCRALGLPFSQIRALRRLAVGPLSMGGLADALVTDRPNASALADALERRGLVERNADPADGRVRRISLTAAGRSAASTADAILDRPPLRLLQLSPAELATLRRLLAGAPEAPKEPEAPEAPGEPRKAGEPEGASEPANAR